MLSIYANYPLDQLDAAEYCARSELLREKFRRRGLNQKLVIQLERKLKAISAERARRNVQ